MTQIGAPSRNECLSTVSTTVLNIPDTRERDNVAQEVAAPKWSKSQKKRRRQGKKRRALALAKLCQQEQPESASPALGTRDGGKSSWMISPTSSSARDTKAKGGIQLINNQAERHAWAQASPHYRGHSTPTTSQPDVLECGQGLSKILTRISGGPLSKAQRTSASNLQTTT